MLAEALQKRILDARAAAKALLVGVALSGGASGCAYRFTNEHIVRPEGIRTVAVEAVYDTSREVLPHEHFWTAMQEAFAADGKLRLAPQADADALVRMHLKQASVRPIGDLKVNRPERDPAVDVHGAPPAPRDFKRLSQAGEIRDFGQVRVEMDVEVWSLRTRKLLFSRTYSSAQRFRAVHTDARRTVTTRGNDYLRYEEGLEARIDVMATDIARQVVRDLLVR